MYVDTAPPGACLSFEEGGTSLCGGYDCNRPLDEFEDSIWDFILSDGIHEDCDCRDHLRAELGFEDQDEMERAARSFRAKRRLRRQREGVSDEQGDDGDTEESEGLGELFG